MYFIPGIYVLIFSVVSYIIIGLDNSEADFYKNIPRFLLNTRQVGAQIFSVEVASLLTMLTISFSIMMVVLTIYGSQLSPRSLQDFLERKVTLNIMGYFIGTLIFSICALFFMKADYYSQAVISPSIGIILMILAVVIFIYFIHYISKSIQVTLYIQNLVQETSDIIDKLDKQVADDPQISNEKLDQYLHILEAEPREVFAEKSGFIQYYDEKKLFEVAKKNNIILWCDKMVGEHVLEGDLIIKLFEAENSENDEEIMKFIKEAVYIGNEPNLYDTYGAGSRKLVEIAVRALSPGINDPNTAVFCIEKIGYLLEKISKGLEAKVYIDEKGKVKVVVRGITFEKLLFDHFYQMKLYGSKDLVVLNAIVGALISITKDNTYQVKKQIWEFSQYIFNGINLNDYPDMERNYIYERLYQLAAITNKVKELETKFKDISES